MKTVIFIFILFILIGSMWFPTCSNHLHEKKTVQLETVSLPRQASSKYLRQFIINRISDRSKKFNDFYVSWEGSPVPFKFVLYAVMWPNDVKDTVQARLHNEFLKEGESPWEEKLHVFRIYLYRDKIIAQDKHVSTDGLRDYMIKTRNKHPDFCILVSFEEVIPLADIWNVITDIHRYSDSRVVFAPDRKTIKHSRDNEDI